MSVARVVFLRTYKGYRDEDIDRMPIDRFLELLPMDDVKKAGGNTAVSVTEAMAIDAGRREARLRETEEIMASLGA